MHLTSYERHRQVAKFKKKDPRHYLAYRPLVKDKQTGALVPGLVILSKGPSQEYIEDCAEHLRNKRGAVANGEVYVFPDSFQAVNGATPRMLNDEALAQLKQLKPEWFDG